MARVEAAKVYQDADWIRESEALAEESLSDDEAAMAEQFECVACNKIFKSEKAMTNHTRSGDLLGHILLQVCSGLRRQRDSYDNAQEHSAGTLGCATKQLARHAQPFMRSKLSPQGHGKHPS